MSVVAAGWSKRLGTVAGARAGILLSTGSPGADPSIAEQSGRCDDRVHDPRPPILEAFLRVDLGVPTLNENTIRQSGGLCRAKPLRALDWVWRLPRSRPEARPTSVGIRPSCARRFLRKERGVVQGQIRCLDTRQSCKFREARVRSNSQFSRCPVSGANR